MCIRDSIESDRDVGEALREHQEQQTRRSVGGTLGVLLSAPWMRNAESECGWGGGEVRGFGQGQLGLLG